MMSIEINEAIYKIHPKLTFVGANKYGDVVNIYSGSKFRGIKKDKNIEVLIGGWGEPWIFHKKHDIVYECYSGKLLEEGEIVRHIDNDWRNNEISNLDLV